MLRNIIEKELENCLKTREDLFLIDLDISPDNSIKILIDGDNGVTLEDCIYVSRSIEHNLDREKCDFELKVSSPGLDQPFKVRQQYVKNIGRTVKVVLESHGSVEGKLVKVEDDFIVLNWEEKERIEGKKKKVLVEKSAQVNFNDIKETKVVITFK